MRPGMSPTVVTDRMFHVQGDERMIISMTGFGRGEATGEGISAIVEVKSVNNRFLEVSPRMPRDYSGFEGELREVIRKELVRGKVNVNVTVIRSDGSGTGLAVDVERAAAYKELLNDIRKAAKIKEVVSLSHILAFRDELFNRESDEETQRREWTVIVEAVREALRNLSEMRKKEGKELAQDMLNRVDAIDKKVNSIENHSREQVPQERKRLRERIARLFENEEIDEHRLEMEIVLLADKLDVTEECVRWRSHSKFFREAVRDKEAAGRRLNFLLQEMLREINTMGSKSNDTQIVRLVVEAKEELEKIREQVQNIE